MTTPIAAWSNVVVITGAAAGSLTGLWAHERSARLMLEGAIESWELETVWKGQPAEMLEALPGP